MTSLVVQNPIPRPVIVSSMIGGLLEFYDFTIYGFMTPIVAPLFFPSDKISTSLIFGFGVFGIGFVIRPLGALLFGYIGDHYGRKISLWISIIMMATSTCLMGIMPTYVSWGLCASFGMIFARILQGLSAGGEYSGGIIFAVEHSPRHLTGKAGSLVVAGCMGGVCLGSLVALLGIQTGMPDWMWRLPFLLGSILALVGVYIRHFTCETYAFTQMKSKTQPHEQPRFWTQAIVNRIQCLATFGIAGCSCPSGKRV